MLYIYNAPFLLLQDEMRLLIINCLNKHLNINLCVLFRFHKLPRTKEGRKGCSSNFQFMRDQKLTTTCQRGKT